MQKHGFSLVELLVVIGIIALLAAMLFPVFAVARQRSYSASCLSNLRQLGKATALYASDYDDALPFAPSPKNKKILLDPGSLGSMNLGVYEDTDTEALARTLPDLRAVLKPYGMVGDVWRCQADRMDSLLVDDGNRKDTWFEECGASYDFDDQSGLTGRRLSSYAKPAEACLGADISPFHSGAGIDPRTALLNLLYADAHVKTVPNTARVTARQQSRW